MELPNIRVIVADAHDADGIGSALLAKLIFPKAEVRMVNYGAEQNAVEPEEGMLWLDIAPPPDRVDAFVAAGAAVIDHHEHQKWIVDLFGARGAYSDEPGVSAAVLTFQHVVEPNLVGPAFECDLIREYARLIGIRDTWQKDHELWRDACIQSNAIEFYGFDHWARNAHRRDLVHAFFLPTGPELEVGELLYDRKLKLIEKMADEVIIHTTPAGKRWGIIPANGKTTSDLAEYMREHHDLPTLATFWTGADGSELTMHFSLRSYELDVGEAAVKMGGGGHKAASGFHVKQKYVGSKTCTFHPISIMEELLIK